MSQTQTLHDSSTHWTFFTQSKKLFATLCSQKEQWSLIYSCVHGTAPQHLYRNSSHYTMLPELFGLRHSLVSLSLAIVATPARDAIVHAPSQSAVPVLWNNLPPALKNIQSLTSLKAKLKTHLLCNDCVEIFIRYINIYLLFIIIIYSVLTHSSLSPFPTPWAHRMWSF